MRLTSTTAVSTAVALAGLFVFGELSAGSSTNRVADLSAKESGAATTLTITGTQTPTFTVYKLEGPSRLVIDVSGAELDSKLLKTGEVKASWNVNTWAVSQVVASARRDRKNQIVRVVVSLARSSSYRVRAVGKKLVVRVRAREPRPLGSSNPEGLAAARRDAERKAEAATRLASARAKQAEARAAAEATRADSISANAAQKRKAEVAKRKAAEARLAVALAQINAAKKRAANAEKEMVLAKKSARSAQRNADARAAKASRDAAAAKAEARRQGTQAAKRLKNAEVRTRKAEKSAKRAKSQLANAEKARSEAKKAAKAAKKREKAAAVALAQADMRRQEAERAQRDADRVRKQAERAKKSGSAESAKLTRRAQEAASAAEKRRVRAEKAARVAESRRREAEQAEKASLSRSKSSKAALAAAERRRRQADLSRAEAEKARALAQRDNRELLTKIENAKSRAKEAASRAESFVKAARTARTQAQEARASRLAEERALESAARARAKAERERQRVELATAELKKSMDAHKRAQKALKRRKAAATVATKRARDAGSNNHGARKREAATRKRELAKAEKMLATRKQALQADERKVAKLDRARDKATVTLAELRDAASAAKQARIKEEQLAARLDRRRKSADKSLRMAEQRLAAAETDRKRAAKLAASAEADRATARRQRVAADASRAQAETELREAKADRRRAKAARVASERLAAERAAQKAAQTKKTARAKRAPSRARVNNVKFIDQGKTARVVVGLSAPAAPKVIKNRGKVAILEIAGVSIDKDLERTLDTRAFSGPIKAVSSFRDPKRPGTVRVVVDLYEPVKGVLKKTGNTYYWDFPNNGSRAAKRAPTASSRPSTKLASSAQRASASTSITQQTVAQLRPGRRRVYRGRRIDLNFKDADIHNLLRILATVGGVNIVVPQTVTGTVTVRLKSVPWDQAMEVILSSQGLWYRRDGSLIRVALRETLLKEDEDEAKRRAERIKSEAPEPEIFTLNYASAKAIKVQLGGLVSPKGRIEINDRTNSLIINDIAAHRRRIIDLATRLDTQTPQIQIEARIVEARTTFVREFGVQWGGNAAATPQGGNPTGLVFPNSIDLAGAGDDGQTPNSGVAAAPTNFAVNLPAAIGTGSGGGLGLALGSVGGNFNINLRLSALEDTGSARIISAPKITVSNNVSAKIKSGVSIPISVVSANGTQTQFVPADLSLEVTPKVSQRDCSVSMDVNVTKNEADFANTGARGDPSILTKEATTTILVADGETAVIGGIYTRNTGLNYSKVPFFADIPVLGYFFRNRRENDERSEVLVFVTPKITNRAFLRCE